ncbi:jg17700 [Pararge aegeria aegeria]|uniref:Jg17700 protein n=1 Tax=Pararge aegeria aegeria TaxID=348720 RepID=A0A8S4QSW4_9NEOP|nr:jg17700 [Pararge aegeria aegeria]
MSSICVKIASWGGLRCVQTLIGEQKKMVRNQKKKRTRSGPVDETDKNFPSKNQQFAQNKTSAKKKKHQHGRPGFQ